jgi:hypothetical protein
MRMYTPLYSKVVCSYKNTWKLQSCYCLLAYSTAAPPQHFYPLNIQFHHQNSTSICYPTVTSYCSFTSLHFVLQHSIFTLNVITLFPTGHFVTAMLPLMPVNKYINKSELFVTGEINNYWLTARSRVLLENLPGPQLVKNLVNCTDSKDYHKWTLTASPSCLSATWSYLQYHVHSLHSTRTHYATPITPSLAIPTQSADSGLSVLQSVDLLS